MFKKAALIFTVLASLAMTNAKAIDYAFTDGKGKVRTSINAVMTIDRADQSTISTHWESHWKMKQKHHEVTFHLTSKTAFSGGTQANAVVGAAVHITYHFEGDRAIADTVQFVAGGNIGK
jgi:hypothetical protein